MNLRIVSILLLLIFPFVLIAQVNRDFNGKTAEQGKEHLRNKFNIGETLNYSSYDLIYQRMKWNVNPGVRYIQGEVISYIKSKVDGLSEIDFDLNSVMSVDSIVQNNTTVNFTHSQNKILIPLLSELQKDQIDSVKIYYHGEPPKDGFGTFVKSSHNNIPIVWTLSEPYGAMDWWPCKQSLSDKIDSTDIIVTTPESYLTASNGVLVSDTVENGLRTMHWKHRFPIATYLVAFAVTNYSRYSDFLELENGDSIEILNYVYPENLDTAKAKTPATVQIMNFYNKIIGEYPFAKEKYGHAQFGWSGGMEHQTMSFMANFSYNLIAHELAHQWFGDYITLGTWHDVWLNEGFATYMAALTLENLKGEKEWFNWKKESVERITKYPGGAVFVDDTINISRMFDNRLTYTKGAYLLHMLRWILGDDAFFQGLRSYFNDPEIANGFARNYNLVNHMEAAGDTSLTEFFNDWYYGEGYPIYSVNYVQEGVHKLVIQLSQTPSDESVGFFEMPVPVRVYNFEKTDSIDFVLNNTQNNQEFEVNPGFMVDEIKIDPEYWLVSRTSIIVNSRTLNFSDEIKIYPNPFSNEVTVSASRNMLPFNVNLYNINGNLLQQFVAYQSKFKLENLTKGIYILQIKTPTETIEKKLIKQ